MHRQCTEHRQWGVLSPGACRAPNPQRCSENKGLLPGVAGMSQQHPVNPGTASHCRGQTTTSSGTHAHHRGCSEPSPACCRGVTGHHRGCSEPSPACHRGVTRHHRGCVESLPWRCRAVARHHRGCSEPLPACHRGVTRHCRGCVESSPWCCRAVTRRCTGDVASHHRRVAGVIAGHRRGIHHTETPREAHARTCRGHIEIGHGAHSKEGTRCMTPSAWPRT